MLDDVSKPSTSSCVHLAERYDMKIMNRFIQQQERVTGGLGGAKMDQITIYTPWYQTKKINVEN